MTALLTGPVAVVLLKATALLVVALAAALLLHRASAGARHLVWLVAVAGLLLLPALAVWAPIRVAVLPGAPAAAAAPVGGSVADRPVESAALPAAAGQSAAPMDAEWTESSDIIAPSSEQQGRTWLAGVGFGALAVAGWAVVALALLVWLAAGALAVRRIVRRARPVDDPSWLTPLYDIADRLELGSAPRLVLSRDVAMPFAAGLFTPTIVLPAESEEWSADRRVAVLIHELAHVRRRDLIGHTVGRLACALYWFHPLVWTAARRLRAESERACDDLALSFGTRAADYAEHLLEIVTSVRNNATPAVALAMAHRKEFEGRMLAILDPGLRRQGPNRVQTVSLTAGLGAMALLIGAAAPVPRDAAPARPTGPEIRLASSAAEQAKPERPKAPVAEPRTEPKSEVTSRTTSRTTSTMTSETVVPEQGARQGDRVGTLARTLRTDPNASIRRVAAWGLAEYADNDTALTALVAAAEGDADASVREMAAWALADAPSRSAAPAALVQVLRGDRDPKVHATALWALGSIGDSASVDALLPSLADASPEIRELAAWAIGSAGPKHAPPALVNALSDASRDVRLSAAWALYSIEDPATASAVEAAYRRETDPEVRIGLIRALGNLDDAGVETLEKLVASPDTVVRRVAVTALAGGDASGPWPWPRPRPRPFVGH